MQYNSAADFSFTALCFVRPDDIDNGFITIFAEDVSPYSLGTVVAYSCNTGYELIGGDERRTCVDNNDGNGGSFNGTVPTCQLVIVDQGVYNIYTAKHLIKI